MPAIVTERPYRPVPTDPPRKRWTRLECAALEASGLWDRQRLELVDGELISKMGKNRPHVNALVFLQEWLFDVFGAQYVNPAAPIDVAPEDNPTNEPEPDLIVLTRPSREFPDANPRPIDLCLVVEISDSTLGFDLTANFASRRRSRNGRALPTCRSTVQQDAGFPWGRSGRSTDRLPSRQKTTGNTSERRLGS